MTFQASPPLFRPARSRSKAWVGRDRLMIERTKWHNFRTIASRSVANCSRWMPSALRIIATGVNCVDGIEQTALRAADGPILAEDVIAAVDLPPFDNAAVDG